MVVRAETVHFYVVALIMPPQREQLRCAIVFLIAILGMVRPWRSVDASGGRSAGPRLGTPLSLTG